MDPQRDKITLYTAQRDVVLKELTENGVCYSREAYVRAKYGEAFPIYRECYGWYVEHAPAIVPRPDEEAYPYWAFEHSYNLELAGKIHLLELEVPVDQAVFFDMDDWKKILCLEYMDPDEKKEAAFKEELSLRGLRCEDVMLSRFYPEEKKKILKSWDHLFRHQEAVKKGISHGIRELQAGLWMIRREWVKKEIY